jgi:hypothetical protein
MVNEVNPLDVQSKVWYCGRSIAGIAGSNRAMGMDVCLLCVGCCQVEVCATGR